MNEDRNELFARYYKTIKNNSRSLSASFLENGNLTSAIYTTTARLQAEQSILALKIEELGKLRRQMDEAERI